MLNRTAAFDASVKTRAGSAAGHPEPGSGSASAGRSGAGVANGTRYRYIGDEPLVPLEQAGSAAAGNNGANAGTSAAAKTRSRPNSEYVLYSNGEPVAVNADGAQSYFGTDILGSVRSVTDKYGNVKAQYEYDAFGSPYLANLENDVGFGYCGKVYDSATGLYDYGFRDYAPNSARFTTVDPVRDGANWFSYVVNDPVNYIDPFGLTSTDAGSGNSPKITFSSDIIQQTYIGDTQFNFSIDVSQLGAEPSQNVTFSLVTSKPSFEFTLPTITPESFSQSSTNSDWALTQEEFDNIIANSNTNSSGWDYDSVMRAIARGETPRPSVDNRIKDGSKSWLPMEGPCLMRALMGIAETYAGKNLTEEQLKSAIANLRSSSPLGLKEWTVQNSKTVIFEAMKQLGVDTSNISIKEGRPTDSNYETVKANAFASIRCVTRADKPNSGEVGHYEEGDKNGNLVFDPISGSSDGGRVLVETRYFQLIINE